MFLLEAVEIHLGPLDSWPSYILRYQFVERVVLERVKLLCAFFCGNGLPCYLAYQLYHACNPTTVDASLRIQMGDHYRYCLNDLHKQYKLIIIVYTLKSLLYVNSTTHVTPKISVMDFGINKTDRARLINIINIIQLQQ